ncbi:hypothetical protein BOX15_Mlig026843g2, partial [Macrostomum lignano]
LLVMAGDDDEELNSAAEVYSCFRHIELLPGAKPHPGNVVESDCLATVDLPPAVFPLADSLPSEAVTEGRLSSLQLQGVLYACQRHRTLLPGGERAGFFIGDAAGVGKGRQIAAIILDSLARGRPRHLWLSVSPDLAQDARRDLLAIGCHARVIDGCRQLDRSATAFGLAKDCREGVLFNTYACLVSGGSGASRKTRLEQLIDWCSGDSAPAKFDGCLVLDECHRAKHFLPDAKEAANSKVAAAVIELQQRLPLARVVYCSATGVSELKNLAYMTRLGLWGPSRPFASFQDFRGLLERRGLAAAEMLAAELKATGVYVARGLSFRDAEFAIVDAPLTTGDIALYDSAAALWRRIHSSLLRACSLCRVRSPGQHLRSYWSAHQRFFLQLCLSLRVPAVLAEAKRALDIGLCPVLGLQSTGEAGLHASADLQSPSGFVSVCRHVCRQFLLSHFPAVSTLTGQPETWSSGERQRLLDELEACELPAGGLDLLIDGLGGPDDVAEMTGRRSRIIRCKGRGGFRLESRYAESGDAQSVNASERQRFMAGQKLAAVISDAASTGISLHADPGCANTRRRVHVTAELPWSAEKAVQQLGRTHRSGQSSGPVYRLVCLDLAGERRFCSGVAKRLQTLGALTKADRRAALVGDLGHLNCDTGRGRAALRRLYQYTAAGRLLRGVSLPEVFDGEVSTEQEGVRRLQACLLEMDIFERLAEPSGKCRLRDGETGSVNRFLNRLLGLPVAEQACLFRYFLAACGLEPAPGFGPADAASPSSPLAASATADDDCLAELRADSIRLVSPPAEAFQQSCLPAGLLSRQVTAVTLEITRRLRRRQPHQSQQRTPQRTVTERLTLLCGSVLPLLPALEACLAANWAALRGLPASRRRLRFLRARVDADSEADPDAAGGSRRFVGLRFPAALLRAAEAELGRRRLLAQQAEAASGPTAASAAAGAAKEEAVAPVDERLKRRATTAPPTIRSFFAPAAAAPSPSPSPVHAAAASKRKSCGAAAAAPSPAKQARISDLFAARQPDESVCPNCDKQLPASVRPRDHWAVCLVVGASGPAGAEPKQEKLDRDAA